MTRLSYALLSLLFVGCYCDEGPGRHWDEDGETHGWHNTEATREQQSDAGEQQSDAGEQQSDAGEQQSDAGEQQSDAGEQQSDAGEQQSDADARDDAQSDAESSCDVDDDCAGPSYCDLESQRCTPAVYCKSETDCDPGFNCDDATRLCLPADEERCSELLTEPACAAREDCATVYAGVDCSCGPECTCMGGEPGCVCASFEFFHCVAVEDSAPQNR